jgi:hypothetical protein
MKSAIDVPLPLIGVTGRWHHAATLGHVGRVPRVTPRGQPLSAPGLVRTRFNPGDFHGDDQGFETVYLALDRETALFEKRAQFGNPYGDPVNLLISSRIKNTTVVPVDVILDAVLDLSDVGTHSLLETNAQEITGDWNGYEWRGRGLPPPMGMLAAPTGLAPTQQLARELFQNPLIKGIISISAKVPTTCCLVIFTHKMQSPDSLRWEDPNTGQQELYP